MADLIVTGEVTDVSCGGTEQKATWSEVSFLSTVKVSARTKGTSGDPIVVRGVVVVGTPPPGPGMPHAFPKGWKGTLYLKKYASTDNWTTFHNGDTYEVDPAAKPEALPNCQLADDAGADGPRDSSSGTDVGQPDRSPVVEPGLDARANPDLGADAGAIPTPDATIAKDTSSGPDDAQAPPTAKDSGCSCSVGAAGNNAGGALAVPAGASILWWAVKRRRRASVNTAARG